MRRAFSILAFLYLAFHARAEWYAVGRSDAKPSQKIEGNELIQRVPVQKLDLLVTAVLLRPDTENPKYYWVEATLDRQRDSGAGYLLAFDDVVLSEIKTRGDKWAIGFESLELARRCFKYLRELHKLDEAHARDATKA